MRPGKPWWAACSSPGEICGGKQFALVELVTALSVFLTQAHFELTSQEPPVFHWQSRMLRQEGRPVRVVSRCSFYSLSHNSRNIHQGLSQRLAERENQKEIAWIIYAIRTATTAGPAPCFCPSFSPPILFPDPVFSSLDQHQCQQRFGRVCTCPSTYIYAKTRKMAFFNTKASGIFKGNNHLSC